MKRLCLLILVLCLLLSGCARLSAPAAEGDVLEVHYLDVGQADCILLRCEGSTMLIDGGNADDSQMVISYLTNQNVERFDYVVNTHAHEDHVGGLPAVLAVFPVQEVWCPVKEYASSCFEDFIKYAHEQGLEPVCPEPGSTYALGTAEITVFGPVGDYEDANNTSIVLQVEHGENTFLFTGDAETAAEKDILDSGFDVTSTVLKVGHHGSDTSTSYRWLREVSPMYAVIPVGEGNSYGHPQEEILSRLADADVKVWRTDEQGHILCTSDGVELTFTTGAGAPEDAKTKPSVEIYIGNVKSKKFHLPTCSGLPGIENSTLLVGYDLAVFTGYSPCSRCIG